MKHALCKFTLGLIGLVFLSGPAFSWGPNGHRIVAEIGERHLTDEARAKIADIAQGQRLAKLATWPDEIRSDKHWDFIKNSHFLTVEDNQTLEEVLDSRKPDRYPKDVVSGIEYFSAILNGDAEKLAQFEEAMRRNEASPVLGSTKAAALSFLVHLVGDIHQPLHVGRGYDRGGNSIFVLWFGKKTNLHSVWDTDLVEYEGLSFTEFADFIDAIHPENSGTTTDPVSEADIHSWAQESVDERFEIYRTAYESTDYRNTGMPKLEYAYIFNNKTRVEKGMVNAGHRLARILNNLN